MKWLSARMLPLHLLGIVALTACVLMGLWQLGVYNDKHVESGQHLRGAKAVELLDVWGPDEAYDPALEGRPMIVHGTFTGEQILIKRGGDRFWTVAPLKVDRTRSSLLVVRGWSRADPPALPKDRVRFRATVQPGEDTSGTLDPTTGSYPSLSVAALANVVRSDLFSGYAVTDSPQITGGLRPVRPSHPDVSWTIGLRNLAYAMQWWMFGVFAAFMWWRMVTDAVRHPQPS